MKLSLIEYRRWIVLLNPRCGWQQYEGWFLFGLIPLYIRKK